MNNINKNDLKFKSMLMYTGNSNNSWSKRTFNLVDTLYDVFQKLPNIQKNIKFENYFKFNHCLLLASTNNYERLSNYFWELPGFNFDSNSNSHSQHDFIITNSIDLFSHFDSLHYDFCLDIKEVENIGANQFLNKYKKLKKTKNPILFFNNAIIDFENNSVCFENFNDGFFIQFHYKGKDNFKENIYLNKFIPIKNENVFYYSKKDYFNNYFELLLDVFNLDILSNVFTNQIYIEQFDSIKNIEDLKELIKINETY